MSKDHSEIRFIVEFNMPIHTPYLPSFIIQSPTMIVVDMIQRFTLLT